MLENHIDRIRHIENGYLNYYLNIRCFEGYYYLTYVQNKDGKTILGSIFVSCRSLADGVAEIEQKVLQAGYVFPDGQNGSVDL